MQDFELIDSILAGNQKDFERLIKAYESNVFRTAIGLVHNREDAEEITQDVFVKVYRSLSTFNKKAAFSTWLYRLTINTCLNFLQRKKNKIFWTGLSEFFQFVSKDSSVERKMIEKSDETMIKQAIDSLPQKQRIAFILTKYEELPQKQVAVIMDISEGAVEQLVLRARNNLTKKLQSPIGFDRNYLSKQLNKKG